MKPLKFWTLLILLLFSLAVILYLHSDNHTLYLTDRIYSELHHPAWSHRVMRFKSVLANSGSGDHKVLYLVDFRRVSIPIEKAIRFYKQETKRLGFKECHVDDYESAEVKFKSKWRDMTIPEGQDIVVITQLFTSDSTIREHNPESLAD